jgi:hypothetical protein
MINREDSQEVTRATLSVIIILLVAWVMLTLFNVQIPDANRDAVMMVLGALLLRLSDVYAFHFNSSAGSQKKDNTISKMADTVQKVADLPPPPVGPTNGNITLAPGEEVKVEAEEKPRE